MRLNLDPVPHSVHDRRALLLLVVITLLAVLTASPAAPQGADGTSQTATLSLTATDNASGAQAMRRPSEMVRGVAANDKLSDATCQDLAVRAAALSSFVFEDGFETGGTGRWQAPPQPTFSVRGVADLELVAELVGFSGEAVLHVSLTSPSGHAFQTLEVPVVPASDAVASAAESRRLPGYPFPVAVRFATPASGASEGAAVLSVGIPWPVAGTHVVHHGLYGAWTASATISATSSQSGASTITCPPRPFTLEP